MRNSPEQISSGEVDDFVTAAVQNGSDHIEVEIDDLVQFERRRHRQLLPVHRDVNQSGAIMRHCLLKGRTDLFWIIDMQSEQSRALSNLREIGIDQVCSMLQETCRLHFELNKSQRSIVEDDDLHWQFQLPQREKIPHQHGETTVAGERNNLASGMRELSSNSLRQRVCHR